MEPGGNTSHDRLAPGRSAARERAVHLLYEAESRGIEPAEVLAGLPVVPEEYTVHLVGGVGDSLDSLDGELNHQARGWTVERMPALDRAVLRLAAYELISCPDVPTAVVIDEAVELAKTYSTDDSPRFVNGVLAALARHVRS